MRPLKEYFADAKKNRWAIGHFNFSGGDALNAIVSAAREAKAPCVMVGTSEGESKFIGMPQAAALVHAVRESTGYDVYLNSDHFKKVQRCKDAIEAGYDTILFDGHELPYEQNISETHDISSVAKNAGNIMVEGELGYLRGSSEVQEKIKLKPEDYTQPEQAADFVKRTGVGRLAIAIGNIHGIVTDQEVKLDIDLLKLVVDALPETYLVLHGASGLTDEQVSEAIKAGITNVHFNTELRIAYSTSIREELMNHPDLTTPYKYMAPAADALGEVVKKKIELFMAK